MSPKLCIICCQPLPITIPSSSLETLPGSNGSKTLNDILTTYFIAKKLLKFSDHKCLEIVETRRKLNSSEVFRLCGSCEEIVNKAVKCHQKILNLKEEIQVLGDSLKQVINDNDNLPKGEGTEDDETFLEIRNLISSNEFAPEDLIVKVEAEAFPVEENEDIFAEDELFLEGGENETMAQSGDRKRKTSENLDNVRDLKYDPSLPSFKKRKFIKMARSSKKYSLGKHNRDKVDRDKTHLPCKLCSTVCPSRFGFKRHLLDHEQSDRLGNIYDCPKCRHPNLSEEKLRRHFVRRHETSKNTCGICGHVAMKRWLHDKHMLKMHNITTWTPDSGDAELEQLQSNANASEGEASQKTFNCKLCESVYSTVTGFRKHMGIHEESKLLGGKYDCSLCRHPNTSVNGLRKHMTRIHGHEDKNDADGEGRGDGGNGRKYHCTECSSKFKSASGFKRHIEYHEESKQLGGKFDCRICRHPAISLQGLKKHVTEIHGQNLTEEQNETLSNLTAGADESHQDDKREPIAIASEGYTVSYVQDANVDKYSCMKCSSTFISASGYKKHIQYHEESENLGGKFDCTICGHPALSLQGLRKHLTEIHGQVETAILPDLAVEEFRRNEKDEFLTEYFTECFSHSDSANCRKFKCKRCSSVYTTIPGCKKHVRMHEESQKIGGKYDCSICKHPNTSEQALKHHLTKIHNEKFPPEDNSLFSIFPKEESQNNEEGESTIDSSNTDGTSVINKSEYRCSRCASVYTTKMGIFKHKRAHEASDLLENKFDCGICRHPNASIHALKNHLTKIHDQKLPEEGNSLFSVVTADGSHKNRMEESMVACNDGASVIKTKYHCKRCTSVYTSKMGIYKHKLAHETSDLLDNKFDCGICRHPNASMHALKNHLTKIHGQKLATEENDPRSEEFVKTEKEYSANAGASKVEFRCSRCASIYTTKMGIYKHKKAHKASDLLGNKYDCGLCRHPTTSESNLKRHFSVVHPSAAIETKQEVLYSEEGHETSKAIENEEKSLPIILTPKKEAVIEPVIVDDWEEIDAQSRPVLTEEPNEMETRVEERPVERASVQESRNFGNDEEVGGEDEDDDWRPHSSSDKDSESSSSSQEEDDDDDDDDSESDFDEEPKIRKRKSVMSTFGKKHICKKCNHVFLSSIGFQRHLEAHEESIRLNHKFDCDKCGYPANCESKLLHHKKIKHQEKPIYSCNYCQFKTTKSTYLKKHMIRHSTGYRRKKIGRSQKWIATGTDGKKYACDKCPAKYKSYLGLRKHLKDHERSKESGFECDVCKFPCRDQASLSNHKMNIHENMGIVCHICNKTFIRQKVLRNHLAVHKRYDKLFDPSIGLYQCPVCPYRASLQGFVIHKNVNHPDLRLDEPDPNEEEGSHLCNHCGLTFSSQNLLDNHTRSKHVENKIKYNCDKCGRGFKYRIRFKNHMKTHEESRTKDFVCSVCGAMYSNKRTVDAHMARYHPDQREQPLAGYGNRARKPGHHKCKWCMEVFPFKYLLVNHIPTAHKDMYNFSCDICNKAYISASSLRLHKEITHSDGTQRFSCEYCGKGGFIHRHYVLCHHKHCQVKKNGGAPTTTSSSDPNSEMKMRDEQNLTPMMPVMAMASTSTTTPGLTGRQREF